MRISGKYILLIAYIMVCVIAVLILAYYVHHIVKNEIPCAVLEEIPPKYWTNIELIDSNKGIPFRHYHETMIYTIDISSDYMNERLSNNIQWSEMPLSTEDYDDYVKDFFSIPAVYYNYFAEYHLTDSETLGYWMFSGSDDRGEFLVYLCDENKIVYMYID